MKLRHTLYVFCVCGRYSDWAVGHTHIPYRPTLSTHSLGNVPVHLFVDDFAFFGSRPLPPLGSRDGWSKFVA